MKGLRWVCTLVVAVSLLVAARGQVLPGGDKFSLATGLQPVASLAGLWRFQPGDDARYAEPGFDDSKWALLESDTNWGAQGYKGMSGLAWYRFRVELPAGPGPIALYLTRFQTCYEVYVDGKLVATAGKMPPNPTMYGLVPRLVPLDAGPRPAARTATVAVRVWHDPEWAAYYGGGPLGRSEVGDQGLLARELMLEKTAATFRRDSVLDLCGLNLLAGVVALALYALRRTEHEYLWFGVMAFCQSAWGWLLYWSRLGDTPVHWVESSQGFLMMVFFFASLLFYRRLLQTAGGWFFRLALGCCGLYLIEGLMLNFNLISVSQESFAELLTLAPVYLWIVVQLLRRFREGMTDARLLLGPVLLVTVTWAFDDVIWSLYTAGYGKVMPLVHMSWTGLFPVLYTDLAYLVFLLAMLAILIYRFARTSREQDRSASEFESARTVQQVMIPETLPVIDGVTVHAAYHPAQEVGGDFFQILPTANGETLVVVGDVSGKGMGAAMTVSLIVGTLRTLAEYTDSPGAILAGLNRRLYGRGTGFTTCVVLRIAADGRTGSWRTTIANAGHLAPYRNGAEMVTEASLPLGLDPDAEFAEGTLLLAAGDRLTLMTDGVVEAMDAEGTLFGFGRTEAMSGESAERIAGAAREFGQNDDITVLTVDLVGV